MVLRGWLDRGSDRKLKALRHSSHQLVPAIPTGHVTCLTVPEQGRGQPSLLSSPCRLYQGDRGFHIAKLRLRSYHHSES